VLGPVKHNLSLPDEYWISRTLQPRQDGQTLHIGLAPVAFDALDRLRPCDAHSFVAQSRTPHDGCVRFAVIVVFHCATLATRPGATPRVNA